MQTNAIIDENVDIHLVHRYFSNDACLCKMWFKERKKLMYGHVQCATITLIKESILFVNLVLNGIISTVLELATRQPKSKNWFCRKCCGNRVRYIISTIQFLSNVQ